MNGAGHSKRLRRVAVVTGTRAEYGLLRSSMEAIRAHPKLRLQLVATGMHLLRKFGHTIDEIVADGWVIDARVKMQKGDDDPFDQAEGLARGIAGIASFFRAADPDIVLVLGDRIEAMAGALAAITTGRLLAHVHGGDLAPGDFDDSLRHSISKLAHVHLAATRQAGRRLVRMGEDANRVHVVGAPGLDALVPLLNLKRDRKPRSGTALVAYHAHGRTVARERRTMEQILRAVNRADLTPTIVYPNSDRGHTGVIEAIEAFAASPRGAYAEVHRSLPRDPFLRRLIAADVLIGNSSCGVIEASTAGTPAVNVGTRQRGRQPAGRSVVDSDDSYPAISSALQRALRKRPIMGAMTAYGNGTAGRAVARILSGVPLTEATLRKVNRF